MNGSFSPVVLYLISRLDYIYTFSGFLAFVSFVACALFFAMYMDGYTDSLVKLGYKGMRCTAIILGLAVNNLIFLPKTGEAMEILGINSTQNTTQTQKDAFVVVGASDWRTL